LGEQTPEPAAKGAKEQTPEPTVKAVKAKKAVKAVKPGEGTSPEEQKPDEQNAMPEEQTPEPTAKKVKAKKAVKPAKREKLFKLTGSSTRVTPKKMKGLKAVKPAKREKKVKKLQMKGLKRVKFWLGTSTTFGKRAATANPAPDKKKAMPARSAADEKEATAAKPTSDEQEATLANKLEITAVLKFPEAEARTPTCSKCRTPLASERIQITGKKAGVWRCSKCNARAVQLHRLYGTTQLDGFKAFT